MIGIQTNAAREAGDAGASRRQVLKTGAAAAAFAVMSPAVLRAQGRPIKIGLVTPTTGPLAIFAETDAFTLAAFKKAVAGGITIGGQIHPVDVIVKDSQSNSNRASEVANELVNASKVDLMVTAHTPDTVNPVADVCEINEVPCVSTDAPWQPYFFGRKGNPAKGFKWTYHFFWGAEALISTFINMYDELPTNKIVGCLWPNDSDGNAFSDKGHGMPPVLEKRGYKVVNTGSFDPFAENFTSQITAFKAAGVEIVTSVLPPPTFASFWTQAAQQGFKPKIVTPGKSAEFPGAVNALGPLGKNIGIEVWWSPYHPFSSHLTGQSSAQLAAAYTAATKKTWTMPLGFKHALFEVAADVLKRSKALEPDAIRESIASTQYESIVGPVQWKKGPVPNVCTTPLVGGQWQAAASGGGYDLKIVNNKDNPNIKTNGKLLVL
ncbi:MAG: ABC transporter substrate-binding protein [Rhodopseudomonas sp.]|nr:ABC transporter substrate-binding protein [Rhodopseudomonas sp.]